MKHDTRFLNGIRIILALWVAVGHFYQVIGAYLFLPIPILGTIILTNGPAVDGFMVITGFLMAYHYILNKQKEPFNNSTTMFNFILKRLFRLYPVYFLAIIIAYFSKTSASIHELHVLKFFTGSNISPWGTPLSVETTNITDLFTHLTFIHGLIPSNVSSILAPAWSLSLEMQFYLVFPLLFLLFFTRNLINRLPLLIIGSQLISMLLPRFFGLYLNKGIFTTFGQPSFLPYKLPLFILGIIIAGVVLNQISEKYLFLSLICIAPFQHYYSTILIGILLLFFFFPYFKPTTPGTILNLMDKSKTLLSNKFAAFGADISYSLYLFHMILMPFIIDFCINSFPGQSKKIIALIAFILFMTISIFVSYLLFIIVEKPFIKLGKKLISKNKISNLEKHIA